MYAVSVTDNSVLYFRLEPIAEAAGSKTWVCGRSHAGIVVSNPAGGMDVCCERYVLSGIGLRFGLITHPEESYRVCVSECECEASKGEAMIRSRDEVPLENPEI